MPNLDLSELEVKHNPDAKRFEIALPDGSLALVDYNRAGNNIVYTHTEVPTQYEGNGIGGKLAHHVMEYAKQEGLKVQALCPFIAHYVREHEEYQSITWKQ